MTEQEESLKPQEASDAEDQRAASDAFAQDDGSEPMGFSARVEDDELKALFLRLERELERGDYAQARRGLSQAREQIASKGLSEDRVIVEAMSYYDARLGTDPMAVYVLLLCVLTVAMIALALYAR